MLLKQDDAYSAYHFAEQGDSKHEAASAYVEAANCYKKFSPQGTSIF
jgi:hypothetical protein